MPPELTVHYVHTETIGYGRMAMRMVPEIAKLVTVYDGQDPDKPTTGAASWMSTPAHAREWPEGQRLSILTMWETQRLAEGMKEGLHNFELVLVPSEQNVELFSEFHDNVKLVLLGVDDAWHYRPRIDPGVYFNFLCGGSGARKGTDLAVAAFNRVFGPGWRGDGPIPRLIMKNPRSEGLCTGERIELVGGKISAEEELDLYASAHCYLQPSRGEGFGLQPLQAIAQGCPTILTDAHGHASFAHLGYGIGSTSTQADYFSHGFAGDWWEPDFDELCERMEWVYENWETARDFAAASAVEANRTFTWANSARQFVDAHGDMLDQPYTGSGEMQTADLKRYKVVLNKPWKAEIAGVSYMFEPGVVYHEPADVLRILFDGGLLDPECLMDNPGLTEQQLERLGSYSASHSHCHACGHRLNSGPTRADDLMRDKELERLRAENAELRALITDPIGVAA